jgi:putative restriction endonuclease
MAWHHRAMTRAVFTTKVWPSYDDLPELRYHFPKTYLKQVEATVGDWIVYYEPRRSDSSLSSRGGRKAYFATAKVDRIANDPLDPDLYYAYVSSYLPFDRAVAFIENDAFFEQQLQKADGTVNKGRFGRAVRAITDLEFMAIVNAGLGHCLGKDLRQRPLGEVPEEAMEPIEVNRPLVEQLLIRPFRDRAFAASVKTAYRDTCAIMGLKMINGKGRSEVQAAHIRPVAANGPDSVRNGLALSGTVHWMFDRGLISIADDFEVLWSSKGGNSQLTELFKPNRSLLIPEDPAAWPHRGFLAFHREHVFKR